MLPRDFGKQLEACLFIVGDNCTVNRLLATLIGVPLVGCASHRLNRAVQVDMKQYEDDLSGVQALMVRLRTLKQSAKLRSKTSLRPIIRQDTRWSSTFSMVHRYFKLLEHLDPTDDDIVDVLPAPSCNKRLLLQLKDLKKVESVSKALQATKVTLLDVRVWFDGSEDEGSFVESLQKRRRLAAVHPRYDLLSSIPPTSNLVERFFSVSRTTYGQERHSLQPITLEMVLFLRQNGEYWSAQTVDEATR
eukprot:jgi/Phyca11/114634/e_gw1.26.394.1